MAADVRLEARVARAFDAVADETRAGFVAGVRAWYSTAMVLGARRVVRQVGASATEATATVPPWVEPPRVIDGTADVPLDDAGHAVLAGTVFSVRNREAAEWLDANAARLVRRVDAQTRDRIRRIVADGRVAGWSSERIARAIKGEFAYMGVGSPLGHIQSRAHLIAVTETAFGYEKGKRLVVDRMADAGLRMEKSWLTVGDGHVDPTCSDNEAAGAIPHDESFPSLVEEPPAHPGCRCTVTYRALSRGERTDIPEPPAPAVRVPTDPAVLNGPKPFRGSFADTGLYADLPELPRPIANEIRSSLAANARDYPAAARTFRGTTYGIPSAAETDIALVTHSGSAAEGTLRTYMTVGDKFKDAKNLRTLQADLAEDAVVYPKYGPTPWRTTGDVKGVIDHEWGHVVHRAHGEAIDAFLSRTLPERLAARGGAGTVHPSQYAAANAREQWAELFSEARSARAYGDLSPAGQVTREWLHEQRVKGLWD